MKKRPDKVEDAAAERTDAEKAILTWYKSTPADRDDAEEGLRKVARNLIRSQ